MSIDEKRIEMARGFFRLPKLFDLEDLERAYKASKKNIDVMNKQSEKDAAPFRFSSPDIDEFYLILYKELMINQVKKLILNDIEFRKVNGEEKVYIHNLDRKYLDYYNNNIFYRSNLSLLLSTIKAEFKIFEGVNIPRAKTIEEVNAVVEKFASSIEQSYRNFAEQMISEAKKNATYKPDNIIYEVNMSHITSVVSLIKETYNIMGIMFDKRSVLKEFVKKASEYNNMLSKKEEITEEDMQKKVLIDKAAWSYFSRLFKERNATEFIRIYNEGILYISQIVEASSIKEPEEQEPPKPMAPGGR